MAYTKSVRIGRRREPDPERKTANPARREADARPIGSTGQAKPLTRNAAAKTSAPKAGKPAAFTGKSEAETQRAEQRDIRRRNSAASTGASEPQPNASTGGRELEAQRAEQLAIRRLRGASGSGASAIEGRINAATGTDPFAGMEEKEAQRAEQLAIRIVQEQREAQHAAADYRNALVQVLAPLNKEPSVPGTVIPKEYAGLAALVSRLPENFPIDRWHDMSAVSQQAVISKTDLTKQEQWAILNAGPSIDTIALLLDIQDSRGDYGLTQRQVNNVAAQLWAIGNLRTGARNHDLPFSHNDAANSRMINWLDEQQQAILDSFGYGSLGGKRQAWYDKQKRIDAYSRITLPYAGNSSGYETTLDGVTIVPIVPRSTPVPPAVPTPPAAHETSIYDAFDYYDMGSKLGISPDSPYLADTMAYMQQLIDARPSKAANATEMQALLDAVEQKYRRDMEQNPEATEIRAKLPNTQGGAVCNYALDYLGLPYVKGGKDVDDRVGGGLDCSGLVYASVMEYASRYNPDKFGSLHKLFLKNAAAQAASCEKQGWMVWSNSSHDRKAALDLNDLEPGDIVFWHNSKLDKVGHTGIYIGNDQVVEASSMCAEVAVRSLSDRIAYDTLILDSIARPDYSDIKEDRP